MITRLLMTGLITPDGQELGLSTPPPPLESEVEIPDQLEPTPGLVTSASGRFVSRPEIYVGRVETRSPEKDGLLPV
jgi:hypothetical protein